MFAFLFTLQDIEGDEEKDEHKYAAVIGDNGVEVENEEPAINGKPPVVSDDDTKV